MGRIMSGMAVVAASASVAGGLANSHEALGSDVGRVIEGVTTVNDTPYNGNPDVALTGTVTCVSAGVTRVDARVGNPGYYSSTRDQSIWGNVAYATSKEAFKLAPQKSTVIGLGSYVAGKRINLTGTEGGRHDIGAQVNFNNVPEGFCSKPPVNVCAQIGKFSARLSTVVSDARHIKGNRYNTGSDRDYKSTYWFKNTGTEVIDGDDPKNLVSAKIPKNVHVLEGAKLVNGTAVFDIPRDVAPGQSIAVGGLRLKIDGKGRATSVLAGQARYSTETKNSNGLACDTDVVKAGTKAFSAPKLSQKPPRVTG